MNKQLVGFEALQNYAVLHKTKAANWMRVKVEFLPGIGHLVACVRSTRLRKMCCACGVFCPSFVFQVIASLVDFYGTACIPLDILSFPFLYILWSLARVCANGLANCSCACMT